MQGIAKRVFDVIVAGAGLVVLTPLMIIIAVLIRVNMGGAALFFQQRPGLNGKAFRMIKFRTMRELYDECGSLLPDEQRLTPLGAILRRTSLDELPELLNVLTGDMSLVGPRPLLMEYLPLYTQKEARRHELKPGITGWAQVNGRNAISWDKKFELDLWYIDNQSFWLDIKIIALTLVNVLSGHGVNQKGRASADKFTGSKSNHV